MNELRSWLIERVALGERDPSELTEAERVHLGRLEADNAALLARHPPSAVAAEVARRARVEDVRAMRRRRPILWAAPVLVGAAGLSLMVGLRDPADGGHAAPPALRDSVRMKGQALLLHRKTSAGSELLRDGGRASAGDRVQLGFRLDAARHIVLLSVDGRGVVTLHLPDSRAQLAPRFEAGTASVPFSYELDDAPHFERFFLVAAPETFSVSDAVDAAESLARQPESDAASLELPAGLSQLDLTLRKEETR
ncbi:MAG: ActD-like protein [Myxococcota bacterium]